MTPDNPQDILICPLDINMHVLERNGVPAIELRVITTKPDIIKELVISAIHGRPVMMSPHFSDTVRALNSLIEKGIIYREIDGKLYFN